MTKLSKSENKNDDLGLIVSLQDNLVLDRRWGAGGQDHPEPQGKSRGCNGNSVGRTSKIILNVKQQYLCVVNKRRIETQPE